MVLLNVCLLTNRNEITYREVTVSVNKTNAMAEVPNEKNFNIDLSLLATIN